MSPGDLLTGWASDAEISLLVTSYPAKRQEGALLFAWGGGHVTRGSRELAGVALTAHELGAISAASPVGRDA